MAKIIYMVWSETEDDDEKQGGGQIIERFFFSRITAAQRKEKELDKKYSNVFSDLVELDESE